MLNRIKENADQTPNLLPPNGAIASSRIFLWGVWVVYVGYLLLSELPPGPSLLHTKPETLQEAIDLSLNFWFVMPVLSPTTAPVLHPVLEGLFNVVVAWGLLFWGFLIDGRHQRFPMMLFLIGTAFLTNVFYLPWLALRQPNPEPPKGALNPLEKMAESRVLPMAITTVAIAALAWAVWARPEFGDLTVRWNSLLELLSTDRLAYSFFVDLIVFWLFQSWLVTDDMTRRQWYCAKTLWIARLVPFFGLVIYLLRRPSIKIS